MKTQRILIIAPHLDDEVLGCGGSASALAAEGCEVRVMFIAHRVYNHEYCEQQMETELRHMEAARKILGIGESVFFDQPDEQLYRYLREIIIRMEEYVQEWKPDTVYSPFYNDNNQDHRTVADAVRVVLRPAAVPFVRRWLMYETPSSTEQSPPYPGQGFQPNVYFSLTEEVMKTKTDALQKYETEQRKYPHARSPEALRALAMKRGIESGRELAEAFMLMRQINE